jgi:asparagine synthase (glutamine-hydrolysing)
MRGRLPEAIRTRRKFGLRAPVGAWLRGPLPEFAAELLSREQLEAKGYFRPEAVAQLLERHRAGANYGSALLAVLGLQLWDELFLRERQLSQLVPV